MCDRATGKQSRNLAESRHYCVVKELLYKYVSPSKVELHMLAC